MANITVVRLSDETLDSEMREAPRTYVFEGHVELNVALEKIADVMTKEMVADFNAHPPVADVENGPSEDDVPGYATAEFIRDCYRIEYLQLETL